MASVSQWTEEKEEQLAQMWEERPFLYDHNIKGYTNRAKKDQAIREIAYAIEVPVGNVMKRMTSLRTQFSRAKNKLKTDIKGPSKKSRWLMDHLSFLEPFIESKSPNVNQMEFPEGEVLLDSDMEFEPVIPKRVQFKKKDFKRRHDEVDTDDDDLMAHNATIAALEAVGEGPVGVRKTKPNTPPVKKDQEQLFCDFIAGELRQMADPIAKARLMNKLQNEVFAYRIGEAYNHRLHQENQGNGQEGYNDQPVQCKVDPSENCANNTSALSSPSSTPQRANIISINENDSYKLSPSSSLSTY